MTINNKNIPRESSFFPLNTRMSHLMPSTERIAMPIDKWWANLFRCGIFNVSTQSQSIQYVSCKGHWDPAVVNWFAASFAPVHLWPSAHIGCTIMCRQFQKGWMTIPDQFLPSLLDKHSFILQCFDIVNGNSTYQWQGVIDTWIW
jgi:hypothetical protein